MTEIIVFTGIAAFVVLLIVWTVLNHSARNSERELFLSSKGFGACDMEAGALRGKVLSLERNSEYDYSIRDPMRASWQGSVIYFYEKIRTRNDRDPYAVEEFLFPLPRKSEDPFIIYLKPALLRDGMTTKLLEKLATASWDAHPDDFVRLDLPEELQNSNIIGALAPEGHSLYDLIDPQQLSILLQGGDHGILILRCNADLCSIEYLHRLPGANPLRIWSFIEQMLDAASHMALVNQ